MEVVGEDKGMRRYTNRHVHAHVHVHGHAHAHAHELARANATCTHAHTQKCYKTHCISLLLLLYAVEYGENHAIGGIVC